eukprot:4331512-Pleurochrysis_carterae.AAC.2
MITAELDSELPIVSCSHSPSLSQRVAESSGLSLVGEPRLSAWVLQLSEELLMPKDSCRVC